MPNVEKESATRLQPRAVWGLLDWTIAFSTLSVVPWESILGFNTGKGSRREQRGALTRPLLYQCLSKVRLRFTFDNQEGMANMPLR